MFDRHESPGPLYGSILSRGNGREDFGKSGRFSVNNELAETAVPVQDLGIVSRRQPPQQHAGAILIVVILIFSFLVYSLNPNGDWSDWGDANCRKLHNCACEHSKSQLVRQMADSWSSVAFIFAGTYVLGFGTVPVGAAIAAQNHAVDFYESFETFMVTLGASLVLLGWSSWLFHASLSMIGQIAQSFSLFLVASSISFYCLTAGDYIRSGKQFYWGWIGVSSIVGLLEVLFPVADPYLCASMWGFVLTCLFLMKRRRNSRMSVWIIICTVLLQVVGFLSWMLDYLSTPVFCSPMSVFQGHALWHFLLALSILLIFFYLRSEEAIEPSVEQYWTPAHLQNAEL